jgi:S-DNA-T family DNA segregation ATPase FtsK/SpoIIIE
MDVVVRTPHGDADLEIVAAPTDSTLADLLHAVTGQAPPAACRVDGRTVSTAVVLTELDLVIGSLIDTRPVADTLDGAELAHGAVGLVQLTGRGAGIVRTLAPGRYRVGSARRLHAAEMETAPVETPAFELSIDDVGNVQVTPEQDADGALGAYSPTLANQLLDRERPWMDGRLHVGGRVFELERPAAIIGRRQLPAPATDGSVPFQRSPAPPPAPHRLVVGAIRDAASGGGQLWQRRQNDPHAFDIPFGIDADGLSTASVDLRRHRGVALVGSDRFTAGLARTLLVEVCTMHGPADLEVVVASTADRIAQWNWAKWLPHIRHGVPTAAPHLFADTEELAGWASTRRNSSAVSAPTTDNTVAPTDSTGWRPPTVPTSPSPVTLLVLDDIALWSKRDSPVRSLLIDPPPDLRIMALCVGLHEAPGLCTALLEEIPPATRLAQLSSAAGDTVSATPALFGSLVRQHGRLAEAPQEVADIRPALVETPQATVVARQLAPLDDLDSRRRLLPPTRLAAPPLAQLVDESARRSAVEGLAVSIGIEAATGSVPAERRGLTIDLTSPRSTIIAASHAEQHDRTVAAIVLGAATQRSPDDLAILIVGRERPSWHGELPHIAGWAGRDEADDAPRLVHRVAHVLAERPELRVVVFIEHAFDRDDPLLPELVMGMTELAVALPNVHIVLTADHPDSVPPESRASCGVFVSVSPSGTSTAWFGERSVAFIGVDASSDVALPGPTEFDVSQLMIRPATHGRGMTPLERRLSRSISDDVVDDELATAAVARQIIRRNEGVGNDRGTGLDRPSLLPPPLPLEVDAAKLRVRSPGDGVPIGLVDRPELAENGAYWWQPGKNGSILVAGSPRSGMTAIIDLIMVGVAARIAADDLHVYAVEALPQRRRAFAALPHTGSVVIPDDSARVELLITELHRMMTERLQTPEHDDRPDIVLLIGDVGRMRRTLTPETVNEVFRQLGELAASGASVGMNVVAVTTRVDDLGPLMGLDGDRLVGPMTDPGGRTRLGAPPVGPADRHTRRCWSTAEDRRVQLATPPAVTEVEIRRLAPEAARQRHPRTIVPASDS